MTNKIKRYSIYEEILDNIKEINNMLNNFCDGDDKEEFNFVLERIRNCIDDLKEIDDTKYLDDYRDF